MSWLGDESGQDLIEYALLASVISVALVGTIQTVADGIIPFFDMVLAAFQSV
jgi:Flp pilus assembly pilin Flp